MLKRTSFRALAGALAASAALSATAAPTVYFGEDLNAADAAAMTNAFAARQDFLARLSGFGTEGFDGYAAGALFPSSNPLSFAGAGVSATLTGGDVRNTPFSGRFAVEGTNYLNSFFNQRLEFSSAIAAFGLFVNDANELDNDPATTTVGGRTLTQAQIEARPFDSVDGILRIVTERAPGVFEVLYDGSGATFPADSTGMFVGIIDAENPFTNLILVNGASGLDGAFTDGFGYDSLVAATAAQVVPEPSSVALALLALGLAARTPRRRYIGLKRQP